MATTLPPRPRETAPPGSYAIVASRYHSVLTEGLVAHFRAELEAIAPGSELAVYWVPGSFEVPLAVQEAARLGTAAAVTAFGVIIEGQTAHATMIGQTITESLQRIALATSTPVIHEVLLVKDEAQARARCLESGLNRGTEAARAAVEMAAALKQIRGS